MLNKEAFETVLAGVRSLAGNPGFRAAWSVVRTNFGGRFLDFIDGVVAKAAMERPATLQDAWKLALASEAERIS